MKIHEFQAKQILRQAGVPVLKGIVACSADEAAAAFTQLGSPIAVVKAQIHAGGRGKGTMIEYPQQHGVQLVRSAAEAAEVAGRILGSRLVTIQTALAAGIASVKTLAGIPVSSGLMQVEKLRPALRGGQAVQYVDQLGEHWLPVKLD